jgi:hypothetical protein
MASATAPTPFPPDDFCARHVALPIVRSFRQRTQLRRVTACTIAQRGQHVGDRLLVRHFDRMPPMVDGRRYCWNSISTACRGGSIYGARAERASQANR